MSKPIDEFEGEFGYLSNFHNTPVTYNDVTYLNSEAAFQAQKDPTRMQEFANLPPNKAKRLGRRVRLLPTWDAIKDEHMLGIVRSKFNQHPLLAQRLIDTGARELIEGNWWNDTYWGVCKGKGLNKLGHILMRVRTELKQERGMSVI